MNISETEYAPYYHTYVKTVGEDVFANLNQQLLFVPEFIKGIPVEKGDYAYAPDKWTVKEVFGHLIDTERVMAYRALRIARADETPLPGFEENDYVTRSRYHERSMDSLAAEFETLRKGNLFLFESFNDEELSRIGIASGKNVSVRALLFIIAGHVNHHINILKERYF